LLFWGLHFGGLWRGSGLGWELHAGSGMELKVWDEDGFGNGTGQRTGSGNGIFALGVRLLQRHDSTGGLGLWLGVGFHQRSGITVCAWDWEGHLTPDRAW
jgi:hypothetical protein